MSDALLSRPAPSRHRPLLVGLMPAIVALLAAVTGCGAGAKADTKVSYPPASLDSFKAFAATGDAGAVHTVGTSSTGQHSCPNTTIYATVGAALHGRALEADLSAFFLHSGLISNDCPTSVLAYYSQGEYRADGGSGYPAGSVALTVSGAQRDLAVDTGAVTASGYDITSKFSFSF